MFVFRRHVGGDGREARVGRENAGELFEVRQVVRRHVRDAAGREGAVQGVEEQRVNVILDLAELGGVLRAAEAADITPSVRLSRYETGRPTRLPLLSSRT